MDSNPCAASADLRVPIMLEHKYPLSTHFPDLCSVSHRHRRCVRSKWTCKYTSNTRHSLPVRHHAEAVRLQTGGLQRHRSQSDISGGCLPFPRYNRQPCCPLPLCSFDLFQHHLTKVHDQSSAEGRSTSCQSDSCHYRGRYRHITCALCEVSLRMYLHRGRNVGI